MKTKVNDRPEVIAGQVDEILRKGFSNINFSLKPVREVVRRMVELKSKGLPYFRVVSKGIESCYQFEMEGYLIIVWTSYIAKRKAFREDDQIWVLIIDHHNKDPFFSFPINRWGEFYERMFNTARVYKLVAENMPVCAHCNKSKLSWTLIRSDDYEVVDEEFHNRTLVCLNPECDNYDVDTKTLVTEIHLPDAADQKFFALPFIRSQRIRKNNQLKNKTTIPRRLIRFWSKLGIKMPKKKFSDFTDLEYEKSQKGKIFRYHEEAIDELLYYDERQNEQRC